MTYADTGPAGTAVEALLPGAVHRSRAMSVDGVLERLFTFAFRGLVYPQIWEDPVVDIEAMELAPHHHVVAIASGGCNVLSYLAAGAGRVTAVDLNRAHVALLRLKLAGLAGLPAWDDFYSFFGDADEADNTELYRRHIAPRLDAVSRRYWEGRGGTGRRRIDAFRRGFYRHGLLGRFIGAGHLVARLHGVDVSRLLEARSLADQRRIFDTEIAPLFDRKAIRWITDRRASLFGLGIPPAQYEALAGGARMSDVLRERLRRLACGFPLRDNYFAWQAFGRAYAPSTSGPLPPYLEERNFRVLRDAGTRTTVERRSVTDALAAMPRASVDRVVLLDAQDWMTDAQLNALWRAVTVAAAPGARVICRTAGANTILPGRVDADILKCWTYGETRSRLLHAKDRSSIYGGFHVYERAENGLCH